MFVAPKFCIRIVFSFSWGHFNSQEKLKTMLMQNFGVSDKEHYGILLYFLEWFRTTSSKYKTMTSLPAKYGANFRELSRIWEFLPTLRGVIILPPSQPRFLARLPRWQWPNLFDQKQGDHNLLPQKLCFFCKI